MYLNWSECINQWVQQCSSRYECTWHLVEFMSLLRHTGSLLTSSVGLFRTWLALLRIQKGSREVILRKQKRSGNPLQCYEMVLHVEQQAESPVLRDYVMKDPIVTTWYTQGKGVRAALGTFSLSFLTFQQLKFQTALHVCVLLTLHSLRGQLFWFGARELKTLLDKQM